MKRSTPLKRTTALKPNPDKPLKRTTPMRKKSKGNGVTHQQLKQRQFARIRSGGRCEFEHLVAYEGLVDGIRPLLWERCKNRGGETAHIYRRGKCGKARDHEHLTIDACHTCHTKFDHYHKDVRVPLRYAQRAYDLIVETEAARYASEKEKARVREQAVGSLGERPEAGKGVYR